MIQSSPDDAPGERLAQYRSRGFTRGVLLVPWDSLTRLQREAALLLAAEEGRELAEEDVFRRDAAHTADAGRAKMFAGLWLMRLMHAPIHPLDGEYWTGLAGDFDLATGFDPRVDAFREAGLEALKGYEPPAPPGPGCRCPACGKKYAKRRRRRR
jgi:hypothetical protein